MAHGKENTHKITGATKWWKCSVCEDWKLPSKYRKTSSLLSGLQGRCKDCDKYADKEAKAIYDEKLKQTRTPTDMNSKRGGLMFKHRAGNDTSLSYEDFEDIPDITDIDKETK